MGARVLFVGVFGWVGVLLGAQAGLGQSSIVVDGTLGGNASVVDRFPGNRLELIRGGLQSGKNLFHSFDGFNVADGWQVYFLAQNAGIENILARVTGNQRSDILGTLGTRRRDGNSLFRTDTNLFLINPNGILFGPNARLSVGSATRGSFTATTLDAIMWPDGSRFDAVNPGGAAPLLRIVGDPSGFLASQRQIPGITVNRSPLQVFNTQDLRLLGGNVAMSGGQLNAWGGRVEIGAVAGPGTVGLLGTGGFQFPDGLVRGDVRFSDAAFVDVRLGNGGDIQVMGKDIGVFSGSILTAGIFDNLGTMMSQAGLLKLDATGMVTVAGASSRVANDVNPGATGRGGNLEIEAGRLVVRDGAQLTAITFGKGDAGNVLITAGDRVLFQNGFAFSSMGASGEGKGGNVVIQAPVLEVRDGAQLIASTEGKGDAGNVLITAGDRVLFQGTSADGRFGSAAITRVEAGGEGKGSNVVIAAPMLEVRDGAQLVASTRGKGDAGNVLITAGDRVLFQNGFAFSSVGASGEGKGGNVVIAAPVLEVRDGAQLIASTEGKGDAGNVQITAGDRALFQGANTVATSSVDAGGEGKGGNVMIEAQVLEVRDVAQLVANTRGTGDAGNVLITASDRVLLDGTEPVTGRSSSIFTNNGQRLNDGSVFAGTGRGGDINLATPNLQVSNGGVIDARTANDKPGGDITLTLSQLTLLSGGQILSTSDGSGPAGTVRINATDGIRIAGNDPTYADRFARNGTRVAPITANSGIYVRSTATGAAGNVIIGDQGNTPRLILDGGEIVADSNAVNGGNISLNLDQALIMRNGSLISATAGRAQGAGDGGNITITAPFVLSLPGENNDIIANAFSGTGGNITINADSILNFTVNDFKDFDTLRAQPTNDISASSDFGGSGTLSLGGFNVNPAQGTVQLPSATSIPQPTQGCETASTSSQTAKAEFFTSGRGGRPASPSDPLSSSTILDDLRLPASLSASPQPAAKPSVAVTEATHWHLDSQGRVVLSAAPLSAKIISRCSLTVQPAL